MNHLQTRCRGRRSRVEVTAELVDQTPDLLQVELVRAAEGVEDPGLDAALRIPLALYELEVAGVGAAFAG